VSPVTLDVPTVDPVTVGYATSDLTATAGLDYAAAAGSLTFAPGTTARVVTVSVLGDVLAEPDERFFVDLGAPANATLGDASGTGTILDDDGFTSGVVELVHGLDVVTDLRAQPGPTADRDVYLIAQQPYSSYEVIVDATSGDLGTAGPLVERRSAADTLVQASTPVGTGPARALRWSNSSDVVADERVVVSAPGCTTSCGPDDVYRLRAYDTTYSIPRFNNTGSQVTVLILQNTTARVVLADLYFWSPAGVLINNGGVALNPGATLVANTTVLAPDQSGSITVAHDGGYGGLSGKTVALEPSTGFSFDSPMIPRAR
jgi:hypothetical protein